jgi:hypothetical protein
MLKIKGDIHLGKSTKIFLSKTSLMALGVTFELASKYVDEMKAEIAGWEEGRKVGMGVLPNGPSITIQKSGNGIRYLGSGLQEPDVSILFKNLDSAVMIFTAQLGSHEAVAENRIRIHGDNALAMQATRAMAIVQTYLFPGILLKKTFKRPPKLTGKQIAIKAKIMGLLTPKLIAVLGK